MRLVLDASVCLKWYLAGTFPEPDGMVAFELLKRTTDGRIRLCQPPIWRAEIIAVIARKLAALTQLAVSELCGFEVAIDDSASVSARAGSMTTSLGHHLFDTIYHAVAIDHGIDLVTANENYFRKARAIGNIVLLRDGRAPQQANESPAQFRMRLRRSPVRARK